MVCVFALSSVVRGHHKYKDVWNVPCYVIVIITFTSSALKGIHRRQVKPVRVFTCSQGNLEAKGNLDN